MTPIKTSCIALKQLDCLLNNSAPKSHKSILKGLKIFNLTLEPTVYLINQEDEKFKKSYYLSRSQTRIEDQKLLWIWLKIKQCLDRFYDVCRYGWWYWNL